MSVNQVLNINYPNAQSVNSGCVKPFLNNVTNPIQQSVSAPLNPSLQVGFRTTLNPSEVSMYNAISSALVNTGADKNGITTAKKLDELLKSGKLLDKSSNDASTTLENLYKIIKTPRTQGFEGSKILKQAIDTMYDPTIVTQHFGDIPDDVKAQILSDPATSPEIKADPNLLNVNTNGSGTCPAASLEFNMANRRPAEFARWVEGLTSPDAKVLQKVDLSSLSSSNYLDAVTLLKDFETPKISNSFNKVTVEIKPDKNALIRANIQNTHFDEGERSIVDVLMQSAIMQLGSQQSYDSLTDIRTGKFNSNPQGLIEFEKTYAETIISNKEKLSIIYQDIDENQILKGYKCSFDKMANHITKTIDEKEDVIIGYVFTDDNNKVIGGHEITITDYKKDKDGKLVFICNDTDDDKTGYVEYTADWLLPKIHHAGYPHHIVKDETELLYSA